MADAKRIIEAWRVDYNEHRPHSVDLRLKVTRDLHRILTHP